MKLKENIMIDVIHSDLWWGSIDLETLSENRKTKNRIKKEIKASSNIFRKYWKPLSLNEKIAYIKRSHINNTNNLGIDWNDDYFIAIDGLTIPNNKRELEGTFYLTVSQDIYNKYKLEQYY